MDSSDKYALITGASSGIGWFISHELAKRGYQIIAVSNQPEELEKLKIDIEKKFKVSVILINQDLAREESPILVHNHCKTNNIDIEVLVNNAGMLVYGEATSVEYEKARTIMQLHINTPALLCRLFGKEMLEKKKGYILNVSSISAVMPYPTISLYGPSKAFLRNFSRALRTEMKPDGVYVTCLMPGATATALYDNSNFNIHPAIKFGMVQKPERVARRAVLALFKNRAICIPGLLNKFIIFLVPLIPQGLIALIYRGMLRTRK